jgi:hypothetical protein
MPALEIRKKIAFYNLVLVRKKIWKIENVFSFIQRCEKLLAFFLTDNL